MNNTPKKYCLDANVLIEAWQKYYSPNICPSYWDVLNALGEQNKIFLPEQVYDEIVRTEDELSTWLQRSNIPVRRINEDVTRCLQEMYAAHPYHKYLVDNTKARSLADPWVIAHAMSENAIVVTKEEMVTAQNSKRIKIPNVCYNMKVAWMNDFQLVNELGISFSCQII
jgi:predicted nucleic acid-binding protein